MSYSFIEKWVTTLNMHITKNIYTQFPKGCVIISEFNIKCSEKCISFHIVVQIFLLESWKIIRKLWQQQKMCFRWSVFHMLGFFLLFQIGKTHFNFYRIMFKYIFWSATTILYSITSFSSVCRGFIYILFGVECK